ncbi:MAG: LON peptidase substrate-binding domain-containing protein, partial [Endomicrobiia bacterium]
MSELDKTLNDKNNIQDIPKILPMLPVRDIVVFPAMVLPLAVGREKSIRALEESMTSSRYIFV